MVGFKLPEVEENAEGWGPIGLPEHLKDIPFMPFSKGDRLGRIADFGQMAQQRNFQGRYRDQMSGPAVFNFEKAEEEESFQLIDNKPVKKPAGQQQRRPQGQRWGQQGQRWGQQGQGQQAQQGGPGQGGQQSRTRAQQAQQRRQQPWKPWDQPRAQYTSSVDIRPDWHVIGDQINFSALQKLSTQVGQPEDLVSCGELAFFDKSADRVTPKMPAKLRRTSTRTRSSTTSQDPIIRKLAAEGAGQVFITDALLTTLMCAPRSVYPWDLVITRKGGQLFFDKRANSSLDYLTNGETAPDPLQEDKDNVNGVQSLGMEATAVNQAFREQVLGAGSGTHQLGGQSAPEMGGHAHAGYKYRKWTLGDLDLVVRCEIDGAIKLGDSVQMLAVHALNEFDPKWSGVDWRQKLENQRGAVLATELKNNASKMAKWTAAALLSGVELIKLGYITRASLKDTRNHLVLGTQAVKPRDFAMQMNLNMDNCWGIVRALLDLCMEKLEADGKYLLVKDPNKPQLRIYAVPAEEAIDSQYTEDAEEEEEGQGGTKDE